MPWIKDKDGNWVEVSGSGGGSVTKGKVVAALGYTPAKQADVDDLEEAIDDQQTEIENIKALLVDGNEVAY